MQLLEVSLPVERLVRTWVDRLALPDDHLWVTERKAVFESWLGRRISGSVGGAYAHLAGRRVHIVLINTPRIDLRQQRALEIVVCEELLHMRHWIEGDRRRHSRHGYDRIAVQVGQLTGATLEDVRTCLHPVRRRPYRYLYQCPTCARQVPRKRKGTWSCGICSPVFSRRHVLFLAEEIAEAAPAPVPASVQR